MAKETNKKMWRFTKVIYFIITLPIVFIGGIGSLIAGKTIYYPGSNYTRPDIYIGILYFLGIIVGYLIFTDLIRRIISYINNGKFKGFISYIEIFKKHSITILILLLVIIPTLIILSNNLSKECSGDNEKFTDDGKCDCVKGYKINNGTCKITLEQSIINSIPEGGLLREYKEIPLIKGIYLGIYIKDYKIKDLSEDEQPYSDCFGEVEGQGIEGEYHIFTFNNGTITSDIKVPLGFREIGTSGAKLVFPIMNTKINNYNYFGGKKPNNENENYNIELTNLINFKDYNGDGLNQEFLLFDHWDQICGSNNYIVIGLSSIDKKVKIYSIETEGHEITNWESDFIPDNKGNVETGWGCGNHGAEDYRTDYYNYDKNLGLYKFLKTENGACEF